jgi:hypothetical protein
MTTILNPTGTPTIIYNSSGKTIQSLVANAGDTFGDAVAINPISEETVLIVDASGGAGSGAIYFASGFNTGDTVIVLWSGGSGFFVYNDTGSPRGNLTNSAFGQFMLLDSSTQNWQQIG